MTSRTSDLLFDESLPFPGELRRAGPARVGVFIRHTAGGIRGVVGVTGTATSSEDERAAGAGIEAAGLSADTGEG
ncbi:hypothetical protein [Nocardia exalbida]|uniref:hypothetical protein n=1 Tax=Nocardia exalbida TaxID=290231 RepID=UPI0002EAD626|nr:hypothetical protein [Nocardia exalbida]